MNIVRIVVFVFALTCVSFASAQENPVTAMISEISQAEKILNDRYDLQEAQALLTEVFVAEGIQYSLRHTSPWGSGLWTYWRPIHALYKNTNNRLRLWRSAVQHGSVTAELAVATLQPSMAAFRNIDQQVPAWLQSEVQNYVERGRFMDRANAKGCCEPLYYQLLDSADAAYLDPFRPDFELIGNMVLVPSVPQPGQSVENVQQLALDQLTARISTYGENPIYLQALIREARLHLSIYPNSQTNSLDVLLRLLDERMALQRNPVSQILTTAEATPPGAIRDNLLNEAHNQLLEHAAHLVPMLASGADDENNLIEISNILDGAKRLVALRDDVSNPLSSTSGLLRLVSGLNAAVNILSVKERGSVQARDITSFVNDIGTTLGPTVPVTAPYAAPLGAITGLLNRVRAASNAMSTAMNGVSDAIKGDPSGITRANSAAAKVETLLDPRAIVSDMAKGALDGIISSVPFARSLINLFSD